MYKKIFKIIFILSLCLGLSLSSIAAGQVNVSDGSAFITKSELSYELNNLSSRMTQLENSLDSKIDTLVSSYLTRNGVWNGDNQALTIDTFEINGTDLAKALEKRSKYYSLPNDSEEENFFGNYILIDNISKSGMISVKVVSKGYAQSTRYSRDGNGTDNVGTGSVYVIFNVDSDIKSTYPIGKLDSSKYGKSQRSTFSAGDYLIFATTDSIFVLQFFVQKGDKLMWDVISYWNANGTPDRVYGSEGKTTINVVDAYVY